MTNKGVIFDGDDTLWDTMPLYAAARERFLEVMATLGFPRDDVGRAFDRIDEANVEELGFSRNRFPVSMVRTYRQFCAAAHRAPSHSTEQDLTAVGAAVFDAPITVHPSAADLLGSLQRLYVLILATKGDPEIQRRRIEQSGLGPCFAHMFVLPDKSLESFRHIISQYALDPASSWSVGNSLRSDILPALEAGLHAIWIRRDTWSYEHAVVPSNSRLWICDRLDDIVFYLSKEQ